MSRRQPTSYPLIISPLGRKFRSLRAKLLIPIVGLMLLSLLGSTFAFMGGTALTRDRLLRQQVAADAEKVTQAMTVRVTTVADAARTLAHDPRVIEVVQQNTETAMSAINSRAILVRDRFDLDMIQIYNRRGETRVNLVLSTLYRESRLLEKIEAETPIIRVIEGRALLLSRATMPGEAGAVITGVDLEAELNRVATHYRLPTELGLTISDIHFGTSEGIPFEETDGSHGHHYCQHIPLTLGESTVDLLLVRPTDDIMRVTNIGLAVMIGSTLLTTLLLMGLSALVSRSIAHPIQRLSAAAEAVAQGDLSQQIQLGDLQSPLGIGAGDEIGSQAEAFNSMVSELRSLYGDLEIKVEARTRELATAAEVARAVSSSLDMDHVLHALLQSIQKRLGLYLVALFVATPNSHKLVLQEAAGEGSEPLKAKKLAFPLDSRSVLGAAMTTGHPQVIPYAALEPVHLRVHELPSVGSAAAIPLLAGQTPIGVLYAQHEQSEAMTPELVNLLVTLADQIAIGVENTRLYRTEQQRRHLAELLELTGRTLSSSLDMKEVPERVLSLLNTLVPYERGLLLLQDEDVLKPLAHYGFPDDDRVRYMEVPITHGGVFQRIVETRRPLIMGDIGRDPSWQQLPWLELHQSWMGMPLISRGNVIGMVSLTRREPNAFNLEDTMWVQAFAMQAGIALENAQLYAEIAHFNEQLEQQVQLRTQELNQAYHALEQLDRTKSDFIEIAAHELRTPLTVIKGNAYLLQKFVTATRDDKIELSLGGILNGVERLHEIVNSMLDVAKIDSQTLQMFKSEICLDHVIERVCNNLESDLENRQLSLDISTIGQLPTIHADADLLCKVFEHLLVNAIKYTPDGGEIQVTGHTYTKDGHPPCVEIVVSDTGIGIAPDHHDLIFEKFYQTGEVALHSSGRTKFKGGGPGLGLAIARGIVLAHGGEIWVESEGCDEERCPGSHFHVRLPVRE